MTKRTNPHKQKGIAYRVILWYLLSFIATAAAYGQGKKLVIKASNEKASITDGENFSTDWKLDPQSKPDIYYVNIPSKKSIVKFKTDQGQLIFHTRPGQTYSFIVVLNEKDSCAIAIASVLPPDLPVVKSSKPYPVSFPFEMIGAKIFFKGMLNQKEVNIEFDLGAGTSVVNRNASAKLGLLFAGHTVVSNTDGVNKERTSLNNSLNIGGIDWNGVPLTEVGNMKPYEDLIIGNTFFRNHIIEIDYDKKRFTVHQKLPVQAKNYTKLPVFYEQHRPKFEATLSHNGKTYDFWFLFDTGRDGSMLLGEDFTSKNRFWDELQPLTFVNGRKIIRLDATIAGLRFPDIVTNAADPAKPNGRPSLFGNQILNHFNAILDNTAGFIYLKPNGRSEEPYSSYKDYLKEMEKLKKN